MSKRRNEEMPVATGKKRKETPGQRGEYSSESEDGLDPGSFYDRDYDAGSDDGSGTEDVQKFRVARRTTHLEHFSGAVLRARESRRTRRGNSGGRESRRRGQGDIRCRPVGTQVTGRQTAPFSVEKNRGEQGEAIVAEENLDDEAREILGVDPLAPKSLNVKLHPSVLRRGKFWYENGLSKDEKEDILEKYGTPVGVVVPELNREVEKKLPSHAKTRDSLMRKRQLLAAAAFKANGWLLSTFVDNKEGVDRLQCLEILTDVAKLLAEIMNSQTKSRRALILGGLNKQSKNILEETRADNLLFGEKLTEKVKESKSMESWKETDPRQHRPPARFQLIQKQRARELQEQLPQPAIQSEGPIPGTEPVQKSGPEKIGNVGKVVGRLRKFVRSWGDVTSDSFILRCVSGYKIEFCSEVFQSKLPRERKFSREEVRQLEMAIEALRQKGAIEACRSHERQFISSYFIVPKSDGSSRFILNLKQLNKFIETPHFKIEDIRTATGLVFPGYYMAKIDLEDAYFTVSVHHSSRKYLRFIFQGQLYQFVCLPFGLSVSPFIFTKLLKPVVTLLRAKGCMIVVYLDDFLCIGTDAMDCKKNVSMTVGLLESLGFCINKRKSCCEPATRCEFLGFIIDSSSYVLELPTKKRKVLLDKVLGIFRKRSCSILLFAKLIGSLVAACPAVEYGVVYTKALERLKTLALFRNDFDFDAKISIPKSVLSDLAWWINAIPRTNNSFKSFDFVMELYTDASNTGWGATTGNTECHGFWTEEQKNFHINYKELFAVKLALEKLVAHLRNCQILLRVDNTTAIAYINRMGGIRYESYNKLAKEIWQWAENRKIFLFASYIPSGENKEADRLSRLVNDDTEWELNNSIFANIVGIYGQPEIDLFASTNNAKCKNFLSWRPGPGVMGVDAFTYNWTNWFFYAFPPVSLILKTLVKIRQERSSGILVVPFWAGQPWFPLFKSLLCNEALVFGPDINMLLSPCRKKSHPRASHLKLMEEVAPSGIPSQTDGRKSIREAFVRKGVPMEAMGIILASLAPATIKQYEGAIKKWERFASQKELDFLNPDSAGLISFLSDSYEEGASYAEGLEIRIPDLIKTSGPGRFQPLLILPRFKDDPQLCVASVIERYVEMTKDFRSETDSLFLAIKKPHKDVGSQTTNRSISCRIGGTVKSEWNCVPKGRPLESAEPEEASAAEAPDEDAAKEEEQEDVPPRSGEREDDER
ncbi:hypothetical protein TSAR_007120 [Trichomalopsis sarcophagae]|uniref:Reverse transcriptase domain-containing protein n=1 Tax=Trichomalopsis sarcophagae TaxID=543379 RepID=A0A232F707_9HYME|nr:hypothetical protein TSAR_007120 [Trichomalopsis sarcophagae]